MLTLPLVLAAVSAGLAGGIHCVGMCGGISSMLTKAGQDHLSTQHNKTIPIKIQAATRELLPSSYGWVSNTWSYTLMLQSGRIFTYMLIGALFGSFGAAGMLFKAALPLQQIFFVLGNLALIFLGLRLLEISLKFPMLHQFTDRFLGFVHSFLPALRRGSRYPFLLGMSWGCLPCGLLYTVAPFALLSGSAISGAVLMFLFGIAALPHLLFAQTLFTSGMQKKASSLLRKVCALFLIGIGLIGLWYFDMKGMPDFLCVTPVT
ncbi:sulfite exporter TauE/SafE family protein [Undibacterium sp. SXout7W]|uniref:sulfite exporter TauE/SafE family protein n=1 Tax=Undibacterium sp. SXout7W TaxID=3413049 RepID=UPI003BF2C099